MPRLLKVTLALVFITVASASSQATTGAIAGIVRDPVGGAIPGATVTVIPATGPQRLIVSKADGSYRIADVPVGTARVEVTLAGFETRVVDLVVRPAAETACDVVLRVPGAGPLLVWMPAPPEIERLVKQSIDGLWAAGRIPDGNVLTRSTRIAVRVEMTQTGFILSPAALPQRSGYEFRLVDRDTIQEEADRTKKGVYFIVVDRPAIDGNSATLSIGVDVTFPKELKVGKLCCCVGQGQFTKKDNTWTFVKWLNMGCS